MKSDAVRTGMQQAPHRSLFNALGMTEEEAHRHIEKRAMDERLTRREVASRILSTYSHTST